MSDEAQKKPESAADEAQTEAAPRELSEAAKRALAEAEERRRARAVAEAALVQPAPREVGGRDGPDPARYGDWEKDGIVSDF
jgi:hypothetical protein